MIGPNSLECYITWGWNGLPRTNTHTYLPHSYVKSGVLFTTLHFLCNLLLEPISCSVTLHEAGKACQGQTNTERAQLAGALYYTRQTLQLVGLFCELGRKWSVLCPLTDRSRSCGCPSISPTLTKRQSRQSVSFFDSTKNLRSKWP
jgi:hypothetical protein